MARTLEHGKASICRKLHFSVAVRVFSTTQSTAWFSYSLVCKKVKEIIAEGAFHRSFHTAAFQSLCIGSLLRGADQGVFKLACHRTCNRLPYPCGQKRRHPPFGTRVRTYLTGNFENCCRCLLQDAVATTGCTEVDHALLGNAAGILCWLLSASLLVRIVSAFYIHKSEAYAVSVNTAISEANPEDHAVVLHGQGTALPTPEIFGGDISLLLFAAGTILFTRRSFCMKDSNLRNLD